MKMKLATSLFRFLPPLLLVVGVLPFLRALRAESIVPFSALGNPDIRVPEVVSGVPVALGTGQVVVLAAEAEHRSQLCVVRSRVIR
ncbi:hypothetical protein NDU88_001547 [Pleurodeles waltl]|uniref:Uncharacterized protein n=1 Tax=Pleurodeles waltl TaxID=8319 RepID=A0AAV7LD46_PLEWA|nr:hypothetical protein NDU88_001547 [Pleurodeles waltl]